MKKFLVTGGAGFIGSNFIYYLLDKYEQDIAIINIDKLTYAGNIHNLDNLSSDSNYHFYQVDICDRDKVIDIFAKHQPDIVINFAAETHVDRSIVNPYIFSLTNVVGTQNLLEAALKYPVQKFLQISTDEVYGSLGSTGRFNEDYPLNPSSPYAASKAGADLVVQAYHKTFNLPINITRCSNNYGPYQFPEKLIPLTISKCLNQKNIPIYGDGQNIREWLHVNDHCQAIDKVVNAGAIGEIYNIGSSLEANNLYLVKLIINVINKYINEDNLECLPISEEIITFVEDRLGHDYRYSLDITKIKKELDWQPTINLEEGIRSTVRWYLENISWLNLANDQR